METGPGFGCLLGEGPRLQASPAPAPTLGSTPALGPTRQTRVHVLMRVQAAGQAGWRLE